MDNEKAHPHSVSLEISDCSKEDARTVFDALCGYFESDRCHEDVPQQLSEVRPMVWLGTFDVDDAHEGAEKAVHPAPLRGSVTADVQGGYWAVDRFRKTLDGLFDVQDLSQASGDQERELHLRLESR
ncbi:hypothetical protein AB0E88_31700 [Streptomyces sp. NPDC028635]|uniref:hypothetical protein n=1 Tax=Streptomyces sp. NPDC028635 TaxID=3154800 RepID=UPI0033E1FAE4